MSRGEIVLTIGLILLMISMLNFCLFHLQKEIFMKGIHFIIFFFTGSLGIADMVLGIKAMIREEIMRKEIYGEEI